MHGWVDGYFPDKPNLLWAFWAKLFCLESKFSNVKLERKF